MTFNTVKTVKDLIDRLKEFPEDMEVVGSSDGLDYPTDVLVSKGGLDSTDLSWDFSDEPHKQVVVIESVV